MTGSSQTTGGATYTFAYSYNLADALTSETYPSGRVVQTCYDGANRVWQVGGTSCSSTTGAFASNFAYAVHGAPTQYVMGNNVWHAPTYNSRLQMSGFIDSVGGSNADELLNVSLAWNPSGGTGNNGNLYSATYNNGGPGYPSFLTFTQSFNYDGVNRLTSASDSGGWSRTFAYDAYGNMTPSGNPAPPTVSFNGNNQIVGQQYDQAGDLLTVNGNTLAYDTEHMVATETDGVSRAVETYVYDGNGKRVEKYGPSGTPKTTFVYDAQGLLAAEYSTATNNSPCSTCYLTPDHLGTIRLVTDQNGNVVSRHDYLTFGEEVAANAFGRDSHWGAGGDTVNQKFTGKERDSESGLDYFGARYYGSALGRFTGPDAHGFTRRTILNPQKWNKYSYVLNNPFKYVDPDGLEELKIVIKTSIPYKTTWMFGTYSGGEKTNTEIRVETSRSRNNGSPVLSVKELVDPTKMLKGGTVAEQKTAPVNNKVTGVGQTEDAQFFGFHQEATNPLSPVPDWLTPAVSLDLDFDFDDAATWISVSGQTSQFPSFDISVTRANGVTVPVYHRDPWFNNTLLLYLANYVNTGQVSLRELKGWYRLVAKSQHAKNSASVGTLLPSNSCPISFCGIPKRLRAKKNAKLLRLFAEFRWVGESAV